VNLNGYTETGADALRRHIAGQDHDLFQTGLGARLTFPLRRGEVSVIPELLAIWLNNVAWDGDEPRSQLSGGGTFFRTKSLDPARSTIAVGAKRVLLTKTENS
jgi:hypothetical protein